MPPNYQGKTGRTLEEYIENAGSHPPPEAFKQKHVYEGEPPVSFFTVPPNPDQLRLAIFSTKNGSEPFRNVENPTFERDVVMWSAQEIQDYATEIRSKYFGFCKYIRYPVGPTYEELYTYWDAHDIYHMGAQNLWNVLNHMAFETIHINQELRDECAPWMEEYVSEVLTRNEAAREKLKAYNAADHGDLLDYFSDIDLPECGKLEPCYQDTLRDILMSNIMRLRRGGAVDPQYRISTQPFEGAYETGSTDHGGRIVNGIVIVDGSSQPKLSQPNIGQTSERPSQLNTGQTSERALFASLPAAGESKAAASQESTAHASQKSNDQAAEEPKTAASQEPKTAASQESETQASQELEGQDSQELEGQDSQESNVVLPTTPENKNTSIDSPSELKDKTQDNPQPIAANDENQQRQSSSSSGSTGPFDDHRGGEHGAAATQTQPVNIFNNHFHVAQPMVWIPGQPYPVPLNQLPFQPPGAWGPMPMPPHVMDAHAHAQAYQQNVHAQQQHASAQHPPAQHAPAQSGPPPTQRGQHVPPPQRAQRDQHAPPERHKSAVVSSSGSWQATGINTLHGPKAVFRKHSTQQHGHQHHHHHHHNTGGNQGFDQDRVRNNNSSAWSRRSSAGPTARHQSYVGSKNGGWSNGSANGNRQQRRSNEGNNNGGSNYHQDRRRMASVPEAAHQQHRHHDVYGRHNPSHFQHRPAGQTSGGPSPPRPSTRTYTSEECVNADKYQSAHPQSHRYDPCNCSLCRERNRSVFVNLHSLYPEGMGIPRGVLTKLGDNLAQFGMIEDQYMTEHALTVVYKDTQSAIQAVQAMDNRVFADISVKPIRVRFRTGSQYYDPFPTLQFMKYNSPQGEPMELAEYHSLRRRSHHFDQHRPSMPQGTNLPHPLPQSVPRKPPQPTGYGHRHQVTLANLRPSIPAFAGNMPEAVRGPDFATYPTEAPQQQAGPQVISSIPEHGVSSEPQAISSVPEHVLSSEPENMCTKSPSASCITPAIRTESLAFEEAVVPEVGHSVNQGSTLKVVIPSDSPPSSRGYYTPPENPMPKSAGVESSEQAQFEENLDDDGGAEEDQEEIDYGTVIRRHVRPHLSLPTNWVSEGTPDVRQPGGEDNSNKLRAIEANDEKSSGSRDTSAEYVPALAYQPEDFRPASAPGQHRVDNSSAEDSVQSSFPQSNSGGQGEANPLHTSVSAKQAHDESKISGKFAGSDERSILGDSTGAKQESPQPINQANSELLDQQQNRERLDTVNTVNTVVFSPVPISDIAKPASSTANQTPGTVKPTSTATRRIPSAVWSGLAGATKTAAVTKPTPAAVTKPAPAVVTMPAPADSRNPPNTGKYTGPVIVDGSSGKSSAFRKPATPSNPAESRNPSDSSKSARPVVVDGSSGKASAFRKPATPSNPSSAASTSTGDQLDIREWLNANRHSESPETPADPAAFSHQFSEVDAANAAIRRNTPSSKASPASNASSSSSSIEVKTGMTPPTAAPQGNIPTGPAVNPAAMFSPEARSQAFQIIGISTPTPSDRSSEPFPAYTDPMNSPTGAGFPYQGVHSRLAQVQQHMGHGRRPSWPPHPFRVPDDHPLAEANYRQSRANVARQASVRAPAPPQNTPAGTPASQLSPAKAPASTPQHIRAPSSTSSPLNPRAKEFKPAPAAHSTATSAKEESKSAPAAAPAPVAVAPTAAAAPMDQSPTTTRETQKGRSAWQEKKKAKARAKQREKRLIKREAENATKEKNDSTQENAAAANEDVSGATEKDDDKKSDENGTAHGTVEKQDSAKDAAVEDGAKDAVKDEMKIDTKIDTKKDTEEQDPKTDTQNDAKDTDSAAKGVVEDAASKEDAKTAVETDTKNDMSDAKKDAKVDAKDDAKKADGSVKTNPSSIDQLAERRNLASIKVAIPLGFSKMKQNGSNGKATISPLSKQPQLQLPPPQPAITPSTHTLSTPTAPSSRNSAIRTEVQSPTRAPSQQMTPRTSSQRTPAPVTSSQRPSYTTPIASSQRPSYTTPTAYSQQSTSPRRGSIGSTIPVLSSGDTPQRPQVESRPAFNAWSQGPPKMGRNKPQNTIQESPTKKSPGSS